MEEPRYAVVTYLSGDLGRFVNDLRQQLNPALASRAAHVTILPPRPLRMPEGEAVELIRGRCAALAPFDVTIDGVNTFWPVNGVVYLGLSRGSQRVIEVHNAVNSAGLAQSEQYGYLPHLTIAQDLDEARTRKVVEDVSQRWFRFAGERSFTLADVSLVRETPEELWITLATLPLGTAQRSPVASPGTPESQYLCG